MNESYQYNYSENIESTNSMYDQDSRVKKAKKTLSVLSDYFGNISNLKLLDIGASTGIMTNEYAKYFKNVVGIDIDTKAIKYAKNNFNRENIEFIASPIEESNLDNASFDVVTCSHIYEHVPSAEVLLENIFEVLKPGGVCYFAAGNRFQIIETHYRLPFLSYFPKKIANKYISLFTSHDEYYENLKSYRNLKKLVKKFEVVDYTIKIMRNPSKYSADDMLNENTVKYYFVNFLATLGYFFIPTYIWILKKPFIEDHV